MQAKSSFKLKVIYFFVYFSGLRGKFNFAKKKFTKSYRVGGGDFSSHVCIV